MNLVSWAAGRGPSCPSEAVPPLLSLPADAGERGVRRLEKTVTAFRDESVEAIIGTRFSSLHPDREWIVVDLRLRAIGPARIPIAREDLSVEGRDGSRMLLPDREETARELSNIGRTMIAASAVEDPLDVHLPPFLETDRIPFAARSMLEAVRLETGRVASGKLLFRARRGSRIPAAYTFCVSNKYVDVRIPFRLPATDLP